MTSERAPRPRHVVVASFLVDVLDIVMNLFVALVTGSAVVFAEMALGLADTAGSLWLVIGERRARRPGNDDHPLGHRRELVFWALLSAITMLVLGTGLAGWRAWRQWLEPEALDSSWLALLVLGIAFVTNGWTVILELRSLSAQGSLLRAWRRGSSPLVETAFVRDVLGTLSAVVGLAAVTAYVLTERTLFDALGALAIAVLTAVSSVMLIARARSLIAGRSLPATERRRIRRALRSLPQVRSVHRLTAVRDSSARVAVRLDIALEGGLDTAGVERALDAIQAATRTACPSVDDVHVDLNAEPSPE